MNLPESDWVANGVVIRAGANTILDQKKQSFIQGYGNAKGTEKYTEWLGKISTTTPNGVCIYYSRINHARYKTVSF